MADSDGAEEICTNISVDFSIKEGYVDHILYPKEELDIQRHAMWILNQ